jgi:hypothetical protein
MAGMAFGDFDVLEDVLALDRFGILIEPAVAAGLNAVLAVRCTQISVPEEMFDVMPVAIQGMEFNFRGRRVYDKTISAAFVETTDGVVTKGIRNWMQQIGGSESGNGVNKKQYSTLGTLEVYDQSGNVALGYKVRNMWVSQAPAVQLEGSQAQPYMQQVTFTYDKFLQDGVQEN